jgi:hypothetical protein
MTVVYAIYSNSTLYRAIDWTPDREFSRLIRQGRPIDQWRPQKLRYLTREEDVKYELDMATKDENGDIARAHARYRAGAGDCAFVEYFTAGLLISGRARQALADVLDATGQLIPADVEGDPHFFYNCTRLLDAADPEASEVECHDNGLPSQFGRLVLRESIVGGETLFRVRWPADVLARSLRPMPPPSRLFGTSAFVERVRAAALTGFEFVGPCDVR